MTAPVTIAVRECSIEAILHRLPEIDITEMGTHFYRWNGRQLETVLEGWARQQWSGQACHEGSWTTVLRIAGVRAWGAFDEAQDRLAGMAVYRPQLTAEMAQLAAMYVSASHRRMGIARQLTHAVITRAQEDGHRALYVSATPSESAVGFYLSQGFVPTGQPHAELFALEPDDIHMVKEFSRSSKSALFAAPS
jgi:GNAT superfamily N-acetyltransferase